MATKQKKKKVVKEKGVLMIEGIAEATRLDFKIACIKNGTTMKKAIRDFMVKYIVDVL